MKSRQKRMIFAGFLSACVIAWCFKALPSPSPSPSEQTNSHSHVLPSSSPTEIGSGSQKNELNNRSQPFSRNEPASASAGDINTSAEMDPTGIIQATNFLVSEEQEQQIWQSLLTSKFEAPKFHSGYFTQQEMETLRDLPGICTSTLPGIDFSTSGQQGLIALVDYQSSVDDSPRPTPATRESSSGPIAMTTRMSPPPQPLVGEPANSFDEPDLTGYRSTQSDSIPSGLENQHESSSTSNWQTDRQRTSSEFPDVPESMRIASSRPSSLEEVALAAEQNLKQQQAQQQFDPANYNPHANAVDLAATMNVPSGVDPHADVFENTPFPSATECAKCHQQIFDEWSSSSHAYASISPMFHRFEDTINQLAQGTIGYFCMRCHAPVATTMGLRRDQPIFDGPRVFREGVTCVACHRVKNAYTKSNGERRIEPGDVYSPVYGGKDSNGSGVATVTKYDEYFKVKTNPHDKSPGQPIHTRSIQFEELSKADFCMSCHQVAVQPGIKLEVVWDQYRASPAYREGITCQDCHMGRVPGVNGGYTFGPAAIVDNKVVNPERKHSNHVFFGPGYSIAHPGVFPQNIKADRWSVDQWLEFDWRAGWGTKQFEDAVADGQIQPYFPPSWQEADDRLDARDIVDENLKKLLVKKDLRRQVMENGSKIDGPFFSCDPQVGQPLKFNLVVSNLNSGHNMPSGSLGAQPQLWMNVVLVGPDGSRLWESGDLDSWGDLRDLHSSDVVERKVPLDKQLFNLQTKFLTTNVKGTDREMYLPINLDFDQLPFIRPAIQPVSTLNHPPFIRMEAHSIPPLGARKAKYVVPADVMQTPGTYRLSFRMRSRAEPIYFMRFVLSSPEMIRMMNEWIVDVHSRSVVFEVR